MTAEEGMTVEAVTKEETEIEIAGDNRDRDGRRGRDDRGRGVEAVTTEILEEVVMTAEEGMTVEAVTTEILEEILIRTMTGLVANVEM